MPEGFKIKRRSYYWKAIKQHRRSVALLVSAVFTIPLFVFSALPPEEVVEEVPQEIIEEVPIQIEVPVNVTVEVPIEVNQTVEVEVNKTIEVEVNITETVIVNTTIGVNVTEGTSTFLEPQPAPPLIDSDIILCIDTSGSMDANRMPIAQTAIKKVLELINQSNSLGLSYDRVGLVTFAGERDWDWTNDAVIQVGLDFISNQTHLNQVLNATDALFGNGWTDAWAGLNSSLDLLLDNPRNGSALKTILFLTDGAHNTGPWGLDVENGNYTGFMQYPANFSPNFNSARENGTNSQSPVVVARENNVKIFSIGLFQGVSYGFDEDFLREISLDPDYGTFGDFFVGNDTLSLIESFLRARDSASGWTTIISDNTTVINNGTRQIFTLNVTQDIRRLKWDLLWNDSLIDCNVTAINPNGTIFEIGSNSTEDIILVTIQQQKSVIFDYPMQGLWQFNISWSNVSTIELIKSRLSSYEPPIFIESVTQINMTTDNQSRSFMPSSSKVPSRDTSKSALWSIHSKIYNSEENYTSTTPSVLFKVNVTNKNPLFVYHNITPILLADFTGLNVTHSWEPSLVPQLQTNSTISFIFNLTFLEPTFLQGNIYFKVNCTEGYYDAYAQAVSLDYRVTTENITVESHLENRTIVVTENQTISVLENSTVLTVIYSSEYRLENQTTSIIGTTKTIRYAEILQVVDTGKWIGLIATFALLMSFLIIYIRSKQLALKDLAFRFRNRLFQDQSALETALQREGIQIAPNDLNRVITEATNLDQLGDTIYDLTSTKLSPEDLIRVASGTDIEKIAQRLSFATGISIDEIIARLRGTKTIDELIKSLGLDS
ncbi:MAG: VWA domain-containing protein, partial [Candidatus Hodarchaeota archaeon]